jgi:hypothetical protein
VDAKTEAEVVLGLIPLIIDGKPVNLAELKWRPNRAWQGHVEAALIALAAYREDTPEGVRAMSDAQLDLIIAYDEARDENGEPKRKRVLDLEEATERELDVIYDTLLGIAYPKAESQTALMLAIIRGARQAPEPSTSGPSPTGTSEVPTISKSRSPFARPFSTSNGRKTDETGSSRPA